MGQLKAFLFVLGVTLTLPAWASTAGIQGLFDGWFAPSWDIQEDVQYGATTQEVADLYLQRGKRNPAVIFIHGGGWSKGDKSGYRGYYAEKYGWAGISVVAINYRLAEMENPSTQWPAQLQDVQLAVRWVREYADQMGIDPQRICVLGDSAGGHLALFLGALAASRPGDRSQYFANQSPQVSCVVNMFGPADLTHPKFVKVFQKPPLFGGKSYAEAPALWHEASPITAIQANMAPTMVIQGTRDEIVDVEISNDLIKALNGMGVVNEYITYDGGHWFKDLEPPSLKSRIENRALEFVKNCLQGDT